MGLHVFCPASGVSVYPRCGCPATYDTHANGHLDGCEVANLHMLPDVKGDGCCNQDHNCHTASECATDHTDAGCPEEPGKCRMWRSVQQHHTMLRDSIDHEPARKAYAMPPEHCPGGHCHAALEDCAVHHPLVITFTPGDLRMQPAAGNPVAGAS